MATLVNKSKGITLLQDLDVANCFVSRARGLIGTHKLNEQQGLWFPKSNWIHTMFMSMIIDVIYLDKDFKVKKIQKNLNPWKFPAPVFSAKSVVETAAGAIRDDHLSIGDQLYVGH